jgi:DNA-binding NtrC family response regulator
MATILCIDDEPAVGVVLEESLRQLGHQAITATTVEDALLALRRTTIDLIISDHRMPGVTGLELLAILEREGLAVPVIIMTGYSTIEHAVLSIRRGAVDYLTKPVQPEALEIAVNQALELVRLRRENEELRQERSAITAGRQIVGSSEALRRVLDTIAQVAPTRATVLLEGESGTGKELFAQALHAQSPRHTGPFVKVNCAAMPEGLVESALFGHEKGAFTGATGRSVGAFERAHRGTLLLDEISEMRLDLQSKLLRVVQEQEFERVGGQSPVRVDVRIIATTNRDLLAAVGAGTFRSDLYYRLSVVPVRTPPLRERPEDIPLLVQHFVRRITRESDLPPRTVSREAMALLQSYGWPGNIRELSNVVERTLILSRSDVLSASAFGALLQPASPMPGVTAAPAAVTTAPTAPDTESLPIQSGGGDLFDLAGLELIAIERALGATRGNRTRAAKLLGISERTLRNKLNTPKPVLTP